MEGKKKGKKVRKEMRKRSWSRLFLCGWKHIYTLLLTRTQTKVELLMCAVSAFGVNNKMNDGWILFGCSSFRAPALCMPAHQPGLKLNGVQILPSHLLQVDETFYATIHVQGSTEKWCKTWQHWTDHVIVYCWSINILWTLRYNNSVM